MSRTEIDPLERAGLEFQMGIAEAALTDSPDDVELLRFLAHAYATLGRHEDGLATERRLVDLLPRDPRAHYNLACAYALTGVKEAALDSLEEAHRLGFRDADLIDRDEDLTSLRSEPRFQALRRSLREN